MTQQQALKEAKRIVAKSCVSWAEIGIGKYSFTLVKTNGRWQEQKNEKH